jgi:hypothetical protein
VYWVPLYRLGTKKTLKLSKILMTIANRRKKQIMFWV